jgi:hydroxypyruvate isomerase
MANDFLSRRQALRAAALGAGAVALAPHLAQQAQAQQAAAPAAGDKIIQKGRLQQSVCHWCFSNMSVEELAKEASRIGLKAIDLVGPEHFETLKKYNLVGSMTPSHGITKGLNRPENHEECLASIRKSIEATSAAGFPNVICFSGNRDGMSDAEGLKNCATALKQIVAFADEKNVTICMELLNSKVNHGDYMCDRTHWGADLVDAVGSPRFKLLYDIYHMQVQEGDCIATIRKFKNQIGHYHTAGVPGRNDIDPDLQELSYPPIIRAILETGFTGYCAHEFGPKKGIASLESAARLCDV